MELKFSQGVKEIIAISRDIAIQLGNDYISSHHFLLAIIEYSLRDQSENFDFTATEVLKYKNVNFNTTKISLKNFLTQETKFSLRGSIPLTKEAEKVLKSTYLEAQVTRSPDINSATLLLAILRNEITPIDGVLNSYEVDYENAITIYQQKVLPKWLEVNPQYQKEQSKNISLYFDLEEFDSEEVADIIFSLSELYRSIGGDNLEIKGIENLEYSRILIPA